MDGRSRASRLQEKSPMAQWIVSCSPVHDDQEMFRPSASDALSMPCSPETRRRVYRKGSRYAVTLIATEALTLDEMLTAKLGVMCRGAVGQAAG
eukprot:764091-Hanusia_phi.AAC.7